MTAAAGVITWADDGHAGVRFDRHIAAVRMEALWAAVTQDAHLAAWLDRSTCTPGVGGRVSLRAPLVASGFVTVWDPAWTLELAATAADDRPVGVVRWDFERDATGSGIILQHRRIPAAVVAEWASGWAAALDRLEVHVVGGRAA